ncbi:hypothetical protein [Mycobacteroides abscessus]|uniref:hypothetical protein n=1 Tax=Mycobacteroides abscessus TaxID=36809 RepID=UPI000C25F570|nr:hypothetical protein [Mycobacteroides abscessus]MBE5461195.1 hypothetical protein [Mycobacteroides abscessus]QOF41975.1 hypothetical protein E3G69_000999 [Mycobacteroides abscessus]QOF46674.1 hypothetical protein E3G70_000998 [Mycobacteroides abscessus]
MNRRTIMWEAVAAEGRAAELAEWAVAHALPELTAADPETHVEVYRSADGRVVVIATGSVRIAHIASAPVELCRRVPHQWVFELVRSSRGVIADSEEPRA